MKINDAYDYLIHLIACAIHKEAPQPLPDGIDYEQVLSCAVRHDVAGFAYLGIMRGETKPDAVTLDKWKQRYLLGISRNSEQDEARKKLIAELHAQSISTLEVQGTKVKKYYPSRDLRMMSDIDIIIEKEYIPTAEKILKELGYKTVNPNGYDVNGHQKGIHIEIHTDFFSESHKFAEIINEPFRFATVNGDYTATVSDTVFWTYHLLHCLKHYKGKGVGLRRLLDLYFLAPKIEETADMEYINELLSKNGLAEDVKDLAAIAEYFFDGKETDRNISDTVAVIKSAGTHGNMRLYYSNKFKTMKDECKHFVKLRFFLSLVFPKKVSIYKSYPFCKEHHYPYAFAWLHRAIRILFKPGRIKMFFGYIKNIRSADVK